MTEPDLPEPSARPQKSEEVRTPYSFKLMVVLVVAYLGWRLVQGIVWVWDQLF